MVEFLILSIWAPPILDTQLITFKYNSKTKRGYILNGNRWRWIRPQMTPVTVGSITVKQAWPGKRVFTIIAETEEIPNPE